MWKSAAAARNAFCALLIVLSASGSAQNEPSVNTAPRLALVIGNGKYSNVPLKNAPNDAKAMAEQLTRMGFSVTMKVDATRAEMIETIRAFGSNLQKQKGIGLFYFAGHGAQLAWRNYLIPVDAAITDISQVNAQAVDMETLLQSMTRANNPMNLVVVDACRDNPFGASVPIPQKGLSQVDAPAGTLLAYATAPGNTAADGFGANGLYTENMLKEMQAPNVKIEDVFKRVRLNVRLQSKGQQIPWESTSLEQDFYFIPPKALQSASLTETEPQFQAELALWESIQSAKEPAPLEDYLRRFPSGKFSELAQFRLDRVLAQKGEKPVLVADASSNADNPYTKGTVRINTAYSVGDSYTYRRIDLATQAEQRKYTLTVTEATDDMLVYNKGAQVRDPMGNVFKNDRYGEYSGAEGGAAQFYVAEYSVGKKWTARYRVKGKDESWTTEYEFRVVGKEKITIPAGEFDAFKVEGKGATSTGAILRFTYWIAPDRVRRPLAIEFVSRGSRSGKLFANERDELVSFRQLREMK
ncbi:MAG: peptidase caspase catalytic subunit p20 [Betaproteobacteria bacterium]|nr:peptidase caspase catalytic subunit p20 [Betaproteobacteria bacterium]